MNQMQCSDPLLRATRLLLLVTTVVVALASVGALLGITGLWVFGDRISVEAAKHAVNVTTDTKVAISSLLAGTAVALALIVQILRKLTAIIDSVGNGSPFIPENAARLRTMAWLTLAIQGLALLGTPAMVWLRHSIPERNFHLEIAFSFEGLLMALLLFILARVFDQGTRLAEDVEGTV